MDQAELKFHKLLAALATQTNHPLDEITIELYDRHLSQFGYEKVSNALEAIIIGRKSRDPFPSIKEIASRFVPELNENEMANMTANRVWQAVARFGAYQWKEARAWLGEIDSRVADTMGWEYLCKLETEQGPFALAQLRDLAKAVHAVAETEPNRSELEHDSFNHISDQAGSILQKL